MNKKVGLVGENPNDTHSIKALLVQEFQNNVCFIDLIKNVRGGQLDNPKLPQSLKIECLDKKPDVIVLIRDLDSHENDADTLRKRMEWFNSFDSISASPKVFLLNIYELEALIFANVEVFNTIYKTKFNPNKKASVIPNPKESLKNEADKANSAGRSRKKFSVNDCPGIFEKMDAKIVRRRCKYFDDFCKELTMALEVQ